MRHPAYRTFHGFQTKRARQFRINHNKRGFRLARVFGGRFTNRYSTHPKIIKI